MPGDRGEGRASLAACYGIYLGDQVLRKEWGDVLPVEEFLSRLARGKIFPGASPI